MCYRKKILVFIVILFFISILMADEKLVVLQNGLDGYSGCSDVSIANNYYWSIYKNLKITADCGHIFISDDPG